MHDPDTNPLSKRTRDISHIYPGGFRAQGQIYDLYRSHILGL